MSLIRINKLRSTCQLAILLCGAIYSVLGFAENTQLPITTAEFPPFKYTDPASGKVVGFDTEIITNVLNRIGIDPIITVLPFKRSEHLARMGKFAAYYTFTKNPEREKHYYYSEPISAVQDFIFFRKDSDITWETYGDLEDYNLGYSAKYNYDQEFLNSIKYKHPIAPVQGNNEENLLSMLSSKRFDMIICEASVCAFLIKNNPVKFNNITFYEKPIGTPSYRAFYIAFSKNWPGAEKLSNDFNVTLREFAAQPDNPRKAIFEKYGAPCPIALFPECE